jgi:hypothetical protein
MTLEQFRQLASPEALSPALQALWYEMSGDWDRAHTLAQEAAGPDGDWVHAYLHRKEGDQANARYWYNRARRSFPAVSLEAEWEEIAQTLLTRNSPRAR